MGSLRRIVRYVLWVVAVVVLIRLFLYEPFRIPSDSMSPTLISGDYIWVRLFAYGLRLPGTGVWLWRVSEPRRGDPVVFEYEREPGKFFIKRVVGIPGDHVVVRDGGLWINGKPVAVEALTISGASRRDKCVAALSGTATNVVPPFLKPVPYTRQMRSFDVLIETIGEGAGHFVQRARKRDPAGDFETTVPDGFYFLMGDNRDRSRDSRTWGLVPRDNIRGRASSIWLSVNRGSVKCASPFGGTSSWVRWYRIGRPIY